jgi:hypothetical protein
MLDKPRTPPTTLERARAIALSKGIIVERSLGGKQADQVPVLRAVFHQVSRNICVALTCVAVEESVAVERGQADLAGLALGHERGQEPGNNQGSTHEHHHSNCRHRVRFVNAACELATSICRINKRENHQFDDLPSLIREEQAVALGCVFAVIREWYRQGKPRTNEMRHGFHEWCQTLDWIVQNILGCAPLMDGHEEAQRRVSNPVLSWLRNVALELERQNRLDEPITASTLVTTCLVAGIDLPCRTKVDERTARQVVGGLMHREFRAADRILLEGFCIEKDETEYQKPSGDWDTANAYRFTRTGKNEQAHQAEVPKQAARGAERP